MQQFLHAESDQDVCGCECKMNGVMRVILRYNLATEEYHPNMNIWCEGRPLWHQSTFKS